MLRRQFIRNMALASVATALPVAFLHASQTDDARALLSQWIREHTKALADAAMDEHCYYGFVHPSNMKPLGLLTGEYGSYEGIRFVEKPFLENR